MSDTSRPTPPQPLLLGAVLAGGKSSRYGSPKARVEVGGVALGQRARDVLQAVVSRVVLVAGDPDLARDLCLEDRPDSVPGAGPLGGVVTAVRWSADLGHDGVLVLACDLPLVTSELLDLLISEWDGTSVVAPASSGPLGLEPLVAVYPRTILESFETALSSGTRAMGTALKLVPTKMVSADRIAALGDPQRLFLNVNRPVDRERAERALINGDG